MLRFIKDEDVEQVDFKVVDLPGRWHHLTFSAGAINLKSLTRGTGISLSPYPGYRKVQEGDMMARPDPTTAFLDPFHARRSLSVICDIYYPDGETPYERNPRDIVRRAEKHIKKVTGVDAAAYWLPELEFYIFDGCSHGNFVNSSYYEIESEYASWNRGCTCDAPSLGHRLGDTGLGQCEAPRDRHANLRSEMVRRIEAVGYAMKYHHHELGGAGQCEIEPLFDTTLRSADEVMVMKYIIHNTALEFGKTVTFMPKPMHGAPGNGLHFHQLLMKDGKSLFYGNKYASLSPMALNYLGGLLKHNNAIMGFGCPSTNSYCRFGVGLAAPMNIFFSESNRSAALRIPSYSKNPIEARVEYRLPDALCNPYITIAAQLMAGLDGIAKKTDPTKEGFGPFDVNNYELPPEERAKIKSGPTSLEQAISSLVADNSFLTAGKVFPKQVIDVWCELKMSEANEVKKRPHPYEYELYYDF